MVASGTDSVTSDSAGSVSARVWPDWCAALTTFRAPDRRKAAWQLVSALVPYAALWYLMILAMQRGCPYALTLVLVLPAAAFLVRIFILFHDCVHGSFFPSKGANTVCGYLCGILVFTSFEDWRFSHLRHHVSYANLDARGVGDIWTLTRTEYANSSRGLRLWYRLYRHPAVLLGLGAVFSFVLRQRLPTRHVRRRERMGVVLTDLLLVVVALAAARLIGWRTYLLIQLPVMWLAGAAGIWLFYVQHQFRGVYWARKGEWDPLRAAMEGSSFYRLPAVLAWFSGNIGYHHVHHLGPRIPNYLLRPCYAAVPELQRKAPLTLAQSFACTRLKVWDEDRRELTGY